MRWKTCFRSLRNEALKFFHGEVFQFIRGFFDEIACTTDNGCDDIRPGQPEHQPVNVFATEDPVDGRIEKTNKRFF